jgi:hypothetical protein
MITQVIRIGFFQLFDMILKLANEEQKRGENQKKSKFSDTQQVKAAKRSLLFFWGQSKFQVYIGIFHFWINSLRKAHPQDVVVTPPRFYGTKKENLFQIMPPPNSCPSANHPPS